MSWPSESIHRMVDGRFRHGMMTPTSLHNHGLPDRARPARSWARGTRAVRKRMKGPMRIGIDLGGTKIEGIVLDDAGQERARLRTATPRGSYEETVQAVAGVVRELEAKMGARCRVGIGHPGAISPATGLIKNANSTQLNGHPLDRDLKRALERDEVRLSNDANCFAVSEAADGAGRGSAIVFGVILGTGVGGGIVVEGRPLVGAQAIAGEWGHNALPLP